MIAPLLLLISQTFAATTGPVALELAPMPTAPVLELRPTQFDLGMIAVALRMSHLQEMEPAKFEKYILEHPVPVVIGPRAAEDGTITPALYLVDRHHLARAAYELGMERLPIVVKKDFSALTPQKFWETMREKKLVDLLDVFGNTQPPATLKSDVRAMPDSPARSVATIVRDLKGYAKTKKPFGENKWARFFQANLKTEDINNNIEAAVAEAMVLAKSDAASHLPGYRKPRKRKEVPKP